MTFDFRASQLRTSKIIASGSTGTNAKLLLYPISADGSPLNQGNIDPTLFRTGSIGQDVFLYVSGVVGGRDATTHGIALFGGDVYHSGNVWMEGLLNTFNVVNLNAGVNISGFLGATISCPLTMSFYAPVFTAGITGSLQRLVDGSPYLVPGPNITITTQSNGAIAISGSAGGSLSDNLPLDLTSPASAGTSSLGSREDHQHKRPSAAEIGAIQDVLSSEGDVPMRLSFSTIPFTTTATGRKVMQITPGAPNDVLTYIGGNPIWSPASSGKFNTAYQFVAGYNSTLLTDPGVVCGQVAFIPTEISTPSVILRTILSTATGSNTVFVRLYNHTSGAYVCLGGGTTLELSSSATTPPEIVQSVNLVSATNWSTSSAIYELQLYTSNSLYLGILGSAQFVCT